MGVSIRRLFLLLTWISFSISVAAAAAESAPQDILASLKVPAGFTVERVAGPPVIDYPMLACFDDRGRLLIAESSGFCGQKLFNPEKEKHLKEPPHFIRCIEDVDGDGTYDRGTIFADKLTYPEGVAWEDGAVFTVSPPSVWRLEDTDGDGVADKRIELFTGINLTAIADEAHGPTVGPDGRLYWINGHAGHAKLTQNGGPVLNKEGWTQVFRCKTDGSDFETFSGCLGNPAEVVLDDAGNVFANGTFGMELPNFHRSAWARQDGAVHCVEGGGYARLNGKINSIYLRTGIVLPQMTFHGTSAASGLAVYRSNAWGKGYEGNLFTTQFNFHKVLRLIKRADGSSFSCETEEFLSSSRPDFYPTDVLEDADGSLLVVDTGGWYIHCPTASSAKSPSKGGIYRIRKKDAPIIDDPWGRKLDWNDPQKHLGDARWAVREKAIRLLGKNGGARIEGSPIAKRSAIWALTRANGDVSTALRDDDASVRQAAAKAAGLLRDPKSFDGLCALLKDSDASVRSDAAAALGRLNDKRAAPMLLDAVRAGGDAFMEHTLVFALMRSGDREALTAKLGDPNTSVRKVALLALDNIDNGGLTAEKVAPLLDPKASALQAVAMSILSRRGWAGEVSVQLKQWLSKGELSGSQADMIRNTTATLCADPGIQDTLARTLRDASTPSAARRLVLECMAQAPLERFPATWLSEARWALDTRDDDAIVHAALSVLRNGRCMDFSDVLQALALDDKRPVDMRLAAAAALMPQVKSTPQGVFLLAQQSLDKDSPPLQRLAAVHILANAPLSDAQLSQLAERLPQSGPLELPRLFAAYEKTQDKNVGRKLVAALEQCKALSSVPADEVERVMKKYPEDLRANVKALREKAGGGDEEVKTRVDGLVKTLGDGDVRRGKDVFFGSKALCFTCHFLQEKGERVGPDLAKIGAVRSKRDLIEAIVFPSVTFARNYESYLLKTKDGRTLTGLIVSDTSEGLTLFTSERTEVRVPRGDVAALKLSAVSLMPQGLDGQLTPVEFADLLAFLQSLK